MEGRAVTLGTVDVDPPAGSAGDEQREAGHLVGGEVVVTNSDYAAKWGLLSAAAVVGALPIVLTFLFAQRSIISGLTGGAVKG